MDFFRNYRISILAIPAYHLIILFPHAYAISIGKRAFASGKWDNRNPRGAQTKEKLQKGLDGAALATFERAEACHANGFEFLPLFASAVVLGNVAGLNEKAMDSFALTVLGLRVAYTVAYLGCTTRLRSLGRTLTWMLQIGLTWRILIMSAKALAGK